MSALTSTAVPARATPPTNLTVYRDDGPLARALAGALGPVVPVPALAAAVAGVAPLAAAIGAEGAGAPHGLVAAVLGWLVLLGSVSGGRPETGRMRWLVPPVLRAGEYAGLVWVGAVAGGASRAAAFALLAALAFRHYDLVYRLRHRAMTPPAWVGLVSLGWEGRLAVGVALLAAGALPAGFFVVAAGLGTVFVVESTAGWMSVSRTRREGTQTESYEEEEDEGQ